MHIYLNIQYISISIGRQTCTHRNANLQPPLNSCVEHITQAVWWTGHLFKSHAGTHSDLQACIWLWGRLQREENGTEQSGQGAWWGAYHLGKMASVAMQLGTKAIYTSAPLSPFFLPKLHCYWLGQLDWRHSFRIHTHWGSAYLGFWRLMLCGVAFNF